MRYFYHAKQQLSSLTSEMLHDIKRICAPITPLPDYWFSNLWLDKVGSFDFYLLIIAVLTRVEFWAVVPKPLAPFTLCHLFLHK